MDEKWDTCPVCNGPMEGWESTAETWQPIETAPKTARILVADAEGWVGEVEWYDHYSEYMGEGPGWIIANCDSEYGHLVEATHWMPLPAPPSPA